MKNFTCQLMYAASLSSSGCNLIGLAKQIMTLMRFRLRETWGWKE